VNLEVQPVNLVGLGRHLLRAEALEHDASIVQPLEALPDPGAILGPHAVEAIIEAGPRRLQLEDHVRLGLEAAEGGAP
jgi:hypothetical protein